MISKRRPPQSIDEYLDRVIPEQRFALEALREIIKSVVPDAEECIRYQIPSYRRQGALLVGFGATSKHCALYLMSGTTVGAHADALQGFDTSKGTVRFQPDKPLPAPLVRKLVEARLAENAG